MIEIKNQFPAQIKYQVEKSGMEMSIAEKIASNYATFMTEAQLQAHLLKDLSFDNEEDVATAKRIRIDLGKICSSVAKRKKEDKDVLLLQTRYIDGLFKAVEGFARLSQKDAEAIEKHAERIENEKLDDLEMKRNEKLVKFEIDPSTVDTRNMSNEVWQIYIKGVHDQYTQRRQAELKAEAIRIEEERKTKIFEDRLKELLPFSSFIDINKFTVDSSDQDFETLTLLAKKLQKEAVQEQKEREKENQRLKKEAEERIEAEKKASNERKAKEEADRKKLQKEQLKAKKIADDQIAEIKRLNKIQEDQKAEAERKLKKEKEELRKLEKAGPISQIIFAVDNCNIVMPKIDDENIKEVAEEIIRKHESFKIWAKNHLKNCK